MADIPWEPYEECGQCRTDQPVDRFTLGLVKQVVQKTSNIQIRRPLYLNTFKLILRYTFLLCRNFGLRNIIKQEHEKAMQGEKHGILWELEAIESGVNFLRKLGKSLNRGRVGGWCNNVHRYNEAYDEKEMSLRAYLKLI